MSDQKLFLWTLLAFFLLVFSNFIAFPKTPPPSSPAPTPNFALTSLSFNPPLSTQFQGKSFVLEVLLDTGQNQVTGGEIYLRFDHQKIAVEKITPGDFWEKPNILLEKIDTQNGFISYALGGLSAKNGQGILFKISLKPLSLTDSQTPTLISFDPQTKIADINQTSSVLKSTQAAEITILPKP